MKKTILFHSIAHSMRQQSFQEQILAFLSQNDIPAIVLKGIELAEEVYQNPNTRVSGDIDLLIKDKDVFAAHAILLSHGFQRIDKIPLEFLKYRMHHTSYIAKESHKRMPIEMHWNFTIPDFFNLSPEEIWRSTFQDDKGNFHLQPEMNLILLIMHHHRHAFKEFRNLLDIFWAFYRYQRSINHVEFGQQLEEVGLIKATLYSLRQIQCLWKEQSKQVSIIKNLENELRSKKSRQIISKSPLKKNKITSAIFDEPGFNRKEKNPLSNDS